LLPYDHINPTNLQLTYIGHRTKF